MPAFLLLHTLTGQALYRVGSATEAEISQANHHLRQQQCPWRYAPDLHSTAPVEVDSTRVNPAQTLHGRPCA